MRHRGKGHLLNFQDNQIVKLKNCFDSLDYDGGGSISIDELKVPLIGLGLVDSVEEVQELIERVDEDKSGEIEFNEFLRIILSLSRSSDAKNNQKNSVITQFF